MCYAVEMQVETLELGAWSLRLEEKWGWGWGVT
jgi:hypothetical protein